MMNNISKNFIIFFLIFSPYFSYALPAQDIPSLDFMDKDNQQQSSSPGSSNSSSGFLPPDVNLPSVRHNDYIDITDDDIFGDKSNKEVELPNNSLSKENIETQEPQEIKQEIIPVIREGEKAAQESEEVKIENPEENAKQLEDNEISDQEEGHELAKKIESEVFDQDNQKEQSGNNDSKNSVDLENKLNDNDKKQQDEIKDELEDDTKLVGITGNDFVDNEIKMLKLPNDDVVLGEVTQSYEMANLDFISYSKLFEKSLKDVVIQEARVKLDHFLNKYNSKFRRKVFQEELEIMSEVKRDLFVSLSAAEVNYKTIEAVKSGDINSVKILLDNYYSIHEKDEEGNSLIALAVLNKDYNMVLYLLRRGLSPNTVNIHGASPINIAIKNNLYKIAELLKASGAKNNFFFN